MLMINLDSIVKKVEDYTPITAFFLWIITLKYVSDNEIFDLGEKFILVSIGLLAFIAVFYTVIVVSDFLKKVNKLNIEDMNRLKKESKNLIEIESKNLDAYKFDENSELCTKKLALYSELSSVKNRKINNNLFISAILLIIILIIDIGLLPFTIFGISNYVPYILLTLFWLVMANIVKIIVMFYKVYV